VNPPPSDICIYPEIQSPHHQQAQYIFGHRFAPTWLYRPLHELYLFLRRSTHTRGLVGTNDLSFLEAFAWGNKYSDLMGLDSNGVVFFSDAAVHPAISVGEAVEVVDALAKDGYELIGEVLKRILRVKESLDEWKGGKSEDLVVASLAAYG
jgi:hypothetical protein